MTSEPASRALRVQLLLVGSFFCLRGSKPHVMIVHGDIPSRLWFADCLPSQWHR